MGRNIGKNIGMAMLAILSLICIYVNAIDKSAPCVEPEKQNNEPGTAENKDMPETVHARPRKEKPSHYVNFLEEAIGWHTIGGDRYWINPDGEAVTGFSEINGNLYWFDEDGKLGSGWVEVNNETYNFGEDGIVRTGWQKIGEQIYCFSNEGVLLTDMGIMEGDIRDIISSHGGKVGVYFKDLNSREEMCLNNQSFYPCSIIKAAVCAAVYHYADEGKLNPDEYRPYLGPMIKKSDNTSYNVIMRKLGDGSGADGCVLVNSYLESLGIFDTKLYHGLKPGEHYFPSGYLNASTPKDIGLLFEKIYDNEVCSISYSQEMIKLFVGCEDASGIKRGLPQDINYAHKSGWAYYLYLDGGIIYLPQQNYILVIFTDGTHNRPGLFHDISEYVYNCEKKILGDP